MRITSGNEWKGPCSVLLLRVLTDESHVIARIQDDEARVGGAEDRCAEVWVVGFL